MRHIVVLGATSAIAEACARLWSERGDGLILVGRNAARLEEIAGDLRIRGAAAVWPIQADLTETARIPEVIQRFHDCAPSIDAVLIAHGTLPDQHECDCSVLALQNALAVNGTSTVVWLSTLAQMFEERRAGVLAVIGSPAGDRGRATNYSYGAAKALVHTFAEGLRHRLWSKGVRVLVLKPGFVDSPMTSAFDKGGPLWSTPASIAPRIVSAIDRSEGVVYLPGYWRGIMLVIRHLPWLIFRRMSI